MLASVLTALGAVSESSDTASTTFFVGHDTDVNGIGTLLDVGWAGVAPWPQNATVPNAGLHFALFSDATVAVDFVFTTFGDESGPVRTAPVLREPIASFCNRATSQLDHKCVPLPRDALCSEFVKSPS